MINGNIVIIILHFSLGNFIFCTYNVYLNFKQKSMIIIIILHRYIILIYNITY